MGFILRFGGKSNVFERERERERERELQYGFTPRELSKIPNFGRNTLKTPPKEYRRRI